MASAKLEISNWVLSRAMAATATMLSIDMDISANKIVTSARQKLFYDFSSQPDKVPVSDDGMVSTGAWLNAFKSW